MKRLTTLATVLSLAVLAQAADTPPSTLGNNAALKYWAAFAWTPSTDAETKIIDDWQTVPLDAKTTKLLESNQPALRLLHAGAAIGQCDWGLDLTEGPNLLLPHLGKSRYLARFACLSARHDFDQHRPSDAATTLCDLLKLARDDARDPTVISILVDDKIEEDAVTLLASHLKSLDPDALKHLADRLDHLPAAITVSHALQWMKYNVEWTVRGIKAAGDHPDWNKAFPSLGAESQAAVAAAGGTPQAVIAQVQAMLPLIDELATLTSLGQAEFHTRFAAARPRFDANPFAKLAFPSIATAYDTQAATLTRLQLLRAAIAILQQGPDALANFQDPLDHQPLESQPSPDGFQLTSKITNQGQPVTLTISR